MTTGLLAFIAAWNEFLFALTFSVFAEASQTVPVAIALVSGVPQYELPWGSVMAASIAVTLPLIGLVLVFQRQIVTGLTAGAVKARSKDDARRNCGAAFVAGQPLVSTASRNFVDRRLAPLCVRQDVVMATALTGPSL